MFKFFRDKKKWEQLCNQCGECCYTHYKEKGEWVCDKNDPCPYLDEQTKECDCYNIRFKAYKYCEPMTLIKAIFAGYLPSSCGYVKKYRPSFIKSRQK